MLGKLFRRKEEAKSRPQMLMVLLPDAEPLDAARLTQALRDLFPAVRCQATGKDEAALMVEVAGESVMVALMPVPIPGDEVARSAELSRMWKGGPEATVHRAHAIVVATGTSSPSNLARAAAYAAAGLSSSRPTVGWYVGSASQVLLPEVAIETLKDSQNILPVMIWVNVIASKESTTESSLSTIGMVSLGHPEFEIVRTHADPQEWIFRLFDLCNYVLESGAVLKGGQTFGQSADERIPIEEGKSKLGKDGRVIRLVVP